MNMRMPDNYIGLSRGYDKSIPHLGVDFGWNYTHGGKNVDLFAPADGTVVTLVNGYGNTYPNNRIYGNYLVIDHGNKLYSLFGHVLNNSFTVKKGDKVTMGQKVCKMGNTGYANGEHLHFEIRDGANDSAHRVDPLKYLYVYPDQIVSDKTACRSQLQFYKGELVFNPVSETLVITAGHFEYFGEPSVKKPLGYLPVDSTYHVTGESDEKSEGFYWAKIIKDGNTYYVALVQGRYTLAGDDKDKKIELLTEQVKTLTATNSALSADNLSYVRKINAAAAILKGE